MPNITTNRAITYTNNHNVKKDTAYPVLHQAMAFTNRLCFAEAFVPEII